MIGSRNYSTLKKRSQSYYPRLSARVDKGNQLWASETCSFDISGQEVSSSELDCVPASPPLRVPGNCSICPMWIEVSVSKTTTLSPSGWIGVSQSCVIVLYSVNFTHTTQAHWKCVSYQTLCQIIYQKSLHVHKIHFDFSWNYHMWLLNINKFYSFSKTNINMGRLLKTYFKRVPRGN